MKIMLLLLVVLTLVPIMSFAQYSQSDPFEKVELPKNQNDFPSVLNLWKQFNSVKMEYLMGFDSILFYKNDSLSFTYYIANLKFFQKNMMKTDSTLKALTDSVYNKELNSFDSYFTDIEKNRYLDNRKYFDKNGHYFKAEQFSEGIVSVRTIWLFDKKDRILSEENIFLNDSSTYKMLYQRDRSVIIQRHAMIRNKQLECDYITDYNRAGGIISYSYIDAKPVRNEKISIKANRNKHNLVTDIEGLINNKPIKFVFSYLPKSIDIVRTYGDKTTNFKIVLF